MKPLLASVDAVLFDLDGTLVETNIDFPRMREEMVALAEEVGVDRTQVERLDILAIVDLTADFLTQWGRSDEVESLRARAMLTLEEIEIGHARDAMGVPFAREILADLDARGIRIGIVTRNCRRASLMALEAAGIDPKPLVCREDTLRHKPHPDPLLTALYALGARPQASIMVGDHLMDVQSGKAAGLVTIGFLRDHRPDDFFDQVEPDFTARSLEEVLCAIVGSDS